MADVAAESISQPPPDEDFLGEIGAAEPDIPMQPEVARAPQFIAAISPEQVIDAIKDMFVDCARCRVRVLTIPKGQFEVPPSQAIRLSNHRGHKLVFGVHATGINFVSPVGNSTHVQ